jgi:hypothetical protein
MSNGKLLQQTFSLMLVVLQLAGCGGPPGGAAVAPTPAPPTATSTPMQTTGRIEGRVFRSDTDTPITGATVTLYDATMDEDVAEIVTDAKGRYSFVEVKPGTYWLAVAWKYAGDGQCSEMSFRSPEGTTLTFANAIRASEVFQGEDRPYGVDPDLVVSGIGPDGLIFAQYYHASELGVPFNGLDPDLLVKGFGPFGFIFHRQVYTTGELGIPLSGLAPDLETYAVDFKSDGGTCLIFRTSYKASKLGIPLKGLNPDLLVRRFGFSSDGQIRFTFGTSYKVSEQGIPPKGFAPDLQTSGVAFTRDGWFVIISVESDGNLQLIATGIEQKFDVAAGDVLQKDVDVSYP